MFFWKFLVGIRVNQVKLHISNRYRKVFRGRCGMIRYRVLGLKIQANIIAITFCRLHNDKHTKYSPHKNCDILRVKFRGDVNLLDVLTQYEILGFCRLGLNRLGADY